MKQGFGNVSVVCRNCGQTLVEPLRMYLVGQDRSWEFFKFEAEMTMRSGFEHHSGCNNSKPMLLVDDHPLRDSTP
jgi:hypothetical protein